MKQPVISMSFLILLNALPVKAQFQTAPNITLAESFLASIWNGEGDRANDDVLSYSTLQRIQAENKAMSLNHFYLHSAV